jgi:hypothetical protein
MKLANLLLFTISCLQIFTKILSKIGNCRGKISLTGNVKSELDAKCETHCCLNEECRGFYLEEEIVYVDTKPYAISAKCGCKIKMRKRSRNGTRCKNPKRKSLRISDFTLMPPMFPRNTY